MYVFFSTWSFSQQNINPTACQQYISKLNLYRKTIKGLPAYHHPVLREKRKVQTPVPWVSAIMLFICFFAFSKAVVASSVQPLTITSFQPLAARPTGFFSCESFVKSLSTSSHLSFAKSLLDKDTLGEHWFWLQTRTTTNLLFNQINNPIDIEIVNFSALSGSLFPP